MESEKEIKSQKSLRTPKPTGQKAVYHSFAHIYDKLMNDDIAVDKAEQACNALAGMNRTYALELKRAEIENQKPRTIEIPLLEDETKTIG